MSVIVGYNINPNGLSLYLDAGNPNSYPGSGTTWYDLSTNSANVSTGSMTYVNAGLTSSFSSSYNTGSGGQAAPNLSTASLMNFYAPNLTTVATVETVCRFNNWNYEASQQIVIFNWSSIYFAGLSISDGGLFFNDDLCVITAAPFLPNSGSSRNGSAPVFGIWYYLVFEMYNGSIGPNTILNNKMWVNNIQHNMSLTAGTPGTKNFGGGNGTIAMIPGYAPTNANNINGINDYAMFKVYNRTLSQVEITNNYNYYKPFYNLY